MNISPSSSRSSPSNLPSPRGSLDLQDYLTAAESSLPISDSSDLLGLREDSVHYPTRDASKGNFHGASQLFVDQSGKSVNDSNFIKSIV